MKSLKKEAENLQSYVYSNRWWLLIFNGLLLVIWSPWIANISPRTDTEVLINTPYTTFNWLMVGRQGGILTEYVFGLRWFNPFFSIIGGYLLICLAGSLFGYLCWRSSRKYAVICTAFSLVYFSAPIMAEQFNFDMQIFKVAWGFVLCGLAVASAYGAILKRKWYLAVISILCQMWSYSTYQVLVVLFITMTMACFILVYERWTLNKEKAGVNYGRIVLGLIGLFLISFILNQIITKLFFSKGDYLQKQICWLYLSKRECIDLIFDHMKAGLFGNKPFFTPFYFVLAVLVLIVACVRIFGGPRNNGRILVLMAVLALQICPFLLTIVLGSQPTTRAQLAYPMVLACNIVLLVDLCTRRFLRTAFVLLGIVVCWTQTEMTTRLIYTDEIRSQEDAAMSCELATRIGQEATLNKNIAFVGQYDSTLNASCIRGELIGMSIFGINSAVEPHYASSSKRSSTMMKVEGYSLSPATNEQLIEARKIAMDMPSWPAEGCIYDAGDFVVVKLSPDQWPEDFTELTLEETDLSTSVAEAADVMDANIDGVSTDDGMLTINGWGVLKGVDCSSVLPDFYLYDREEDTYYHMLTIQRQRSDLVGSFKNGSLYKYSGFEAKVSMDELEKPLDSYEMYLTLSNDGVTYLSCRLDAK